MKPSGPILGGEIESTDYIALKFIFTPSQSRGDVGGAFCVIIEGATGRILEQQLWVTRPYVDRGLTLDRGWRNFISMFSRLGPYEKVMGDKLSRLLPDLTSAQERAELFQEGKKASRRTLTKIETQIRKAFERATLCLFDVSCDVELITHSELEQAKVIQSSDSSSFGGGEEDDEGIRTLIKFNPVIDPLEGKPVSLVVPGDILEVSIPEEATGPAALVQQFLAETGQAPVFPVEEVHFGEDKALVYLRVSDEIQGVMSLRLDLRLKVKREGPSVPEHTTSLSNLLNHLVYFVIFGAGLIILVFILRYILVAI